MLVAVWHYFCGTGRLLCSPCVSSAKTGPVPGHRWTSWKLCPPSTTGPTLLEEASGLRILWGDDAWYNSTDLMSWLLVFFSHDFNPGLNNKNRFLLSNWVVFFRPLASEEPFECYWNKVGSSDSIKSKVNTPHHIMIVGCAMHGEHKSCDILCSLNVTNSLWEPRLCLFICDILDISNQSQNRMHFYLYFRKKPDWNENISTEFDRISHTKWMHLLLRIWKILWKYAETHIWAYTL